MINDTGSSGLVGGIEAGGTHYKCVLGTPAGDIVDSLSFATAEPETTVARAIEYFAAARGRLRALAIGHFGPVDIDRRSPGYGRILATPKPGWSGFDVLGRYRAALQIPMVFQSDVNVAAIGEGALGAAQGLRHYVYVTIGTGIGGGTVVEGRLLNEARHSEIGHMHVGRAAGDAYAGGCPFHGDCLEGLAAGPALHARWHEAGENLPSDHPAWALQAHYLALMCMNLSLSSVPQRIILGGGVMQQPGLLARIRSRYLDCMNGYMLPPGPIDDFICASPLQGQAATRGSLILAGRLLASPVHAGSNR